MEVFPRLLDHPFYKAWAAGQVSMHSLAAYHRSYTRLVQRIPSYWQHVLDALDPDSKSPASVVEEERSHVLLWERWGEILNPPNEIPDMQPVLDALDAMTPSQLLGAIHAFEIQQPEVARTKKEGLMQHYGFDRRVLTYFDEHAHEDGHIAFGELLAGRFADQKEFAQGVEDGARLFYGSLDGFLER